MKRNITDTKIPFLELSLHTLKIKVMLRTFYRKYLPNCTVIRKLSKQTNTKSDGLLGFPLTYRRIILNLFGIRKEIYLIMRFLKPATFHIQTITRGMSCWKWFWTYRKNARVQCTYTIMKDIPAGKFQKYLM